jgi:hypothetical protein
VEDTGLKAGVNDKSFAHAAAFAIPSATIIDWRKIDRRRRVTGEYVDRYLRISIHGMER